MVSRKRTHATQDLRPISAAVWSVIGEIKAELAREVAPPPGSRIGAKRPGTPHSRRMARAAADMRIRMLTNYQMNRAAGKRAPLSTPLKKRLQRYLAERTSAAV